MSNEVLSIDLSQLPPELQAAILPVLKNLLDDSALVREFFDVNKIPVLYNGRDLVFQSNTLGMRSGADVDINQLDGEVVNVFINIDDDQYNSIVSRKLLVPKSAGGNGVYTLERLLAHELE